jgi:hypothetical protein
LAVVSLIAMGLLPAANAICGRNRLPAGQVKPRSGERHRMLLRIGKAAGRHCVPSLKYLIAER